MWKEDRHQPCQCGLLHASFEPGIALDIKADPQFPFLRQQVAFKKFATHTGQQGTSRTWRACQACHRAPPPKRQLPVDLNKAGAVHIFCVPRPPRAADSRKLAIAAARWPWRRLPDRLHQWNAGRGPRPWSAQRSRQHLLARGKQQGQDPSLRRPRRCTLYPSSTVNRIGRNNGVRNKKAPRKALVY